VPPEEVEKQGVAAFFSHKPIPDDIFAKMDGVSFKADCTTKRSELEYLLCLHKDKNGKIIVGEMVVSKKIAQRVLTILMSLYYISYPIEKMRLVDYYGAEDEKSMRANNSSGFNFRFISNTTKVSKHGLGLAVDINPLYNPYHKVDKEGHVLIEPKTAEPYIDRKKQFDYKIEKGDPCVNLFKAAGFSWGGDWKSCKDYQHFELK